jgi:subtilisin family serine protease
MNTWNSAGGGPRVAPEVPDLDIVGPDVPSGDLEEQAAAPGEVIIRLTTADRDTGVVSADLARDLPEYGRPGFSAAGRRSRSGASPLDRVLDGLNAQALYRVGAGDPDPLADLVVVELPPGQDVDAAAEALADVPGVVAATPHGTFTIATTMTDDPLLLEQWGLLHVRAPEAWDVTTGVPTVVVAVVDSGCDLDHPDLVGRLGAGWNALAPGEPPEDGQGHGTHVAGIIAANANNAADTAGVAWGCTILPVRVLTDAGRSVGVSVAQGIVWAAHNAKIINCSLQGPVDDLAIRTAIDFARTRGVLVVAAMGNSGWSESQPSYPAAYARAFDNVLAVGAVDKAHRRSVWSSTESSNTGSWIGVVAPGTNIVSLRAGGGTVSKSGTSMACPHVAGAAALLRSRAPQLTPAQIIAVLRGTAGALRDLLSDPVPNPSYGSGLIDVAAALGEISQ